MALLLSFGGDGRLYNMAERIVKAAQHDQIFIDFVSEVMPAAGILNPAEDVVSLLT